MTAKYGVLVSSLGLAFALSLCANAADDMATPTKQLKSVQTQINSTRQTIAADKKQQATLKKALAKTQGNIAKLTKELQKTNQALSDVTQELNTLNQELTTLTENLTAHQQALEVQLRNTYQLGTLSPLKQWLMMQDTSSMARDTVYLRYLNQARISQLNYVQSELATAAELQQAVALSQEQLQERIRKQQQQQAELQTSQQEHTKLVASLGDQIESKDKTLQQLVQDENKLSQLLKNLQAKAAGTDSAFSKSPFAQLRGKLPWPLQGKLLYQFGSKQTSSGLPANGLFISSAPGQPVKAVHSGKVVYADWLRGYGRLLIIDHGKGYMTLYAHNQVLNKKLDDKVAAQEIIARSGDGSSHGQAGVYFEIRHNGQPINPLPWMSS